MNTFNEYIGFIGAGNMAMAFVKGIKKTGTAKMSQIWISAPSNRNLCKFEEMKCNVTNSNTEVLAKCDIVVLCVKPHFVIPVLQELQDKNSSSQIQNSLLVSVAAGVSLALLESISVKCRFVRAMPNTPLTVGAGVVAYCRGTLATANDAQYLVKLLQGAAICEEVHESLLDTVCGLSGSGPAYVYTVIQALADGGVKMGLPRNLSLKLSAQTVMGAAKMVLDTGKHPGVLRDEVCSPGGTTIHGVHVLEDSGLQGVMMNAVQMATNRSRELGDKTVTQLLK